MFSEIKLFLLLHDANLSFTYTDLFYDLDFS